MKSKFSQRIRIQVFLFLQLLTIAGILLPTLFLQAAEKDPYSGLWVGIVEVNQVGHWKTGSTEATLEPTVTPFPFRVLFHVDSKGNVKLLSRVYIVQNPQGLITTNTETGTLQTNSVTLLFATQTALKAYQTTNQAKLTIRRISSANFPVVDPIPCQGHFGGTNRLTVTVTVPYNHPTNPFVHPFAPLHDNKKIQNGVSQELPEGVESWTLTRYLTFSFSASDPQNANSPLWNVRLTGGDYTEQFQGFSRSIPIAGSFRLQKILNNSTLY